MTPFWFAHPLPMLSLQVLKKKFFFSDQSVDKSDPVQITLLYGQVCCSLYLLHIFLP